MVYLHRALFVFWTYFFLCIRLHMSPSNWYLPIHSTRNQLKNILAKSFNSIWHRLILLNSRHISSFLKILLTRTVSLVAFLNFPCLVLTFSSVSFLNYFNPGIVFCSTTTRGWARSMRPSRPFAWDLWKRNIFCHARISYIYLKLFPNCFHTYQQLKIDLREHVLHDPGHLFWINDEQQQSTLGSILLHQSSLSSHFRSKDWKFDDLFSFSLKLDGFNYGWWYEDK